MVVIHPLKTMNISALRSDDKQNPSWKPSQDAYQQTDDQSIDTPEAEFWHCRECHHPVTRKEDRIEVNGQHRHVCLNPHGYVYQIGCFSQAPGCIPASQPTFEHSWFPGYAWQIGVCRQCHTLLGWAFRAPDARFWGLILSQLA